MPRRFRLATLTILAAFSVGTIGSASAQPAKASYPSMPPIAQYHIGSQAEEAALARSAAPPSISADAEILTLGAKGYEVAAKGKNGFVCVVERGWATDFDHPEFWSPKIHSPICFNPAAARTVLPSYLKRTEWVLAGVPKDKMIERTKIAIAKKEIVPPAPGAMCYMLSKDGYVGDEAGGHWRPHLMFFVPKTDASEWGANLDGSQVFGGPSTSEPLTTFLVPVTHWSDGTPGPAEMAH